MQIITTILAIFLALLNPTGTVVGDNATTLSTGDNTNHEPPYCSTMGSGACTLGWQYDSDMNRFTMWAYDYNCKQIGYAQNTGWKVYNFYSELDYVIVVQSSAKGPDFRYDGKDYAWELGQCWCYLGPWNWIQACQCAFDC